MGKPDLTYSKSKRSIGRALFIGAAMFLVSCVPTSENYKPEQQFNKGKIPFVTSSNDPAYVNYARYVGRLNITVKALQNGPVSSGTCTGTAIGGRFVLTADHCFDGRVVDSSLDTNLLSASTSSNEALDHFSKVQIGSSDVAILRNRRGPSRPGSIFAARTVQKGEALYVLHHPNGLPLSVSDRRCTATSVEDSQVFTHRCDTLYGSSGALVFAKSDNAVVGVHVGGPRLRSSNSQNAAYHILPLLEANNTLDSLFRRSEFAIAPLSAAQIADDNDAIFGASGSDNLFQFANGEWQTSERPAIPSPVEIARKYCSDSIGVNCGRHGNWSIVAPPNHDPTNIGVQVCGRQGIKYQLIVQDVDNFEYRRIDGAADAALARQTSEFSNRLDGFDRTDWGDRLLTLVARQC